VNGQGECRTGPQPGGVSVGKELLPKAAAGRPPRAAAGYTWGHRTQPG
jgi:hypothetical protein